jgi:hypothetical protein
MPTRTTSNLPLAWAAAEDLANSLTPRIRRTKGPSRVLAWIGIGMFVLSIGSATTLGIMMPSVSDFLPWFRAYLFVGVAISGFFVFVWAAPDEYLARTAKVMRAGTTAGRRLRLLLATVNSAVLLGFAFAAAKSAASGWLFLLLLSLGVIGTIFAMSALSSGTAVVSATSKSRGYDGRRLALLVISFGVFTCGTIVGAGAARYLNAQAVWPSVALAILGLVVGVFAQHHRELNESVDKLDHALAALYNELLAPDQDSPKLREVAMDVESAITVRSRGPLSIAPLPLVDYELRICVYYLLAIVTELPIRVPSIGQAAILKRHFEGHDPRTLLGDLAWEIRRRLFRSAKTIERIDESAFTATRYPRISILSEPSPRTPDAPDSTRLAEPTPTN